MLLPPPSSGSVCRAFYHGEGAPACLQTSRLAFSRALRQAGSPLTSGPSTHSENTNAELLTPSTPRLQTTNSITSSVTEIRERCCSRGSNLPACLPAWLWNGGVAVENNYLRITIGGHLQWHFTVPTAAVTGRRRRDAKHTITSKAKSERAVNSCSSLASCSVISLKDSLAVICKSPAKCSAQHFPPPRRVALQEHNWNYLIGMLPSR